MYTLSTKEDYDTEFKLILDNKAYSFSISRSCINLYIKEEIDKEIIINIIKILNNHFKHPIIVYVPYNINRNILLDYNVIDIICVKKRVLR